MEWMTNPDSWAALLTLTVMEIVLGIDNIVFISILVGKLRPEQRQTARLLGLGLAMFMRIGLLFSITWLATLTTTLFSVADQDISGRDLIFIVGGLFLLAKATFEIHERLEGEKAHGTGRAAASFMGVIIQIILLDIVFSLDSVITAVGMAEDLAVMVIAVVIAVLIMMFASGPISNFVDRHPTVKILVLSFLLLIGVTLIADGLGQHISKGYIYFAMGFSVFVEMLNLRARRKEVEPVDLRPAYLKEDASSTRTLDDEPPRQPAATA